MPILVASLIRGGAAKYIDAVVISAKYATYVELNPDKPTQKSWFNRALHTYFK